MTKLDALVVPNARRHCEVRRAGPLLLLAAVLACEANAPPSAAHVAVPSSPCAALCEHVAACGAPSDFPGTAACTRTCEEEPAQVAGPCREPRIAYEQCMSAAPCEHVRASSDIEVAKRGPCAPAIAAVLACEPSPATPFIHFQF